MSNSMMAVWFRLKSLLIEDEIELVPKNIGTKVEDHLVHLHQLIEELKNENAELSATAERQAFQFEKEIFQSENQLKENVEANIDLKTKLSELERDYSSIQKELRELHQNHDATTLELQTLRRQQELMLQEKKQFSDQLDKRKTEIEKLDANLKGLLEQATKANEEKHAALVKTEEAQLKESNFKHQVNRLDQEKSLLEKQINDLNVEVAQKNHEIHVLKREKSSVVVKLQAQLEHRLDEANLLDKQVAMLKETNDQKDNRVDALAEKIRLLNDSSRQTEEQFTLELAAQAKLVALYKKATDDDQARIKELVSAFEHTQKLLTEAQGGKHEADQNCAALEAQHASKAKEMTNEITKLKDELKHANDLCQGRAFSPEKLETMFPTAATTSKAMHSGMTLTQVYSEYFKSQEQVLNLQNKNHELNEQLRHIVREIEENTPIINQKMKEYNKSLETITCLRKQLSSSLTDYETVQSERTDAKRITGKLERENNRFKMQVADLNRQVQVLLKEIEELKGNPVKLGAAGDSDVTSSGDVTADKVISRHLVTFRDIMEIQGKNQKLLAVVRQLSEDQEEQEKQRTDEKTSELQKELQELTVQLEEIQRNRVKQEEMIGTIVRQRDMYRVLLTHHGFSESLLGSPQGLPNLNQCTSAGIDHSTKSALQQLQSEFDNYKKEKAENERMLVEQLDKSRNDSADQRIEQSKLSSQLEYSEERLGILKSNMENYKKEAVLLREKNQKHSLLMTQQQQAMQNLQHELMDSHEKLAKATVTLDNIRSERDMLKNIEKRLLNEKESLFRNQQQQSQVLANLQAVQNNLERIESESKRNLQFQVEKYEKENVILKAKLESANQDYRAAVVVWEKQNKERQQKIDTEIEKNDKLRDDLVDAYSRYHTAQQELTAARAATASGSPVKGPAAANSSPRAPQQNVNELKKLKDQLLEVQAKVKALQEQLELARKSSEHYMKISSESEMHIKELDEINKQLKDSMEATLKADNDGRKNLEQNLEKMEKNTRNLIEENMKLSLARDSKVQELVAQVNDLKREILANKESTDTAQKTATQAREDCLTQKSLMEETQAKYERELLLHAEDVKMLTAVKDEHQKCIDTITELGNSCRNADEILQEHRTSWAEKEKLFELDQELLNKRLKDMESQNSSLLHQLELMGTQMKALQSGKFTDVPSDVPPIDLQDTTNLLQIIQFVKKEKEILSTQFDSTQSENLRLKLKVEQLTSDCAETKKELEDLINSAEMKSTSNAQHSELLRKVEMMNLLTESNNLLRIEKENILGEKAALEEKLNELTKQLQPLQDSNRVVHSQLEMLSTENSALQQEAKSWQSRTNQLLEQSHRIGPQEYRNLTRELDELKSQKTRLTEELQRKQSDYLQMSSNNFSLKKALEALQSESKEKQQEIQKMAADIGELNRTIMQVKKIGRKYKTQYDELKIVHDLLVSKSKVTEAANQDHNIQEMQKKVLDGEKIIKELKEESDKQKEEVIKAKNEVETILKNATDKDEKARKLLAQAKQRINQINNQKNSVSKELEDVKNEMNSMRNNSGEESSRIASLKALYDSKVAALEAELKSAREANESLKKQCDELCEKMAKQQKQVSKPTTVVGIERGSSSSEPLTANIKPLSAPTQVPGSGLRHAPHVASQSPRSTPTASIRPMAIATAGPSQARVVAVLPTTSITSALPSTSDEDVGMPGIATLPNVAVPQAAVQPTPATATVAPTTVAPTITPSPHALVIAEIAHSSSSSVDLQTGQVVVEPVQNTHIASTSFPTAHHATAMVSPRVEILDVPDTAVEGPAPTTSVIVSPPTTQTQLVQPTIKRKKEDSPGSADNQDSGGSAQKRVRMISEGSQTNQQAAVSSALAMNIAVVPVATVLSRSKVEIPTSEVAPSVHIESVESVPLSVVASTSTATAESVPENNPLLSQVKDDVEIIIVEDKDQNIDWETQEGRTESEFDVEVMEEEEEAAEQMDGFDDDNSFPPRSGADEDMVDDTVEEVEEMAEQPSEVPNEVLDVLEGSSDNQMESDSSSLQAPPSDQCMAPPASPMTPAHDSSETVSEPVISQARRAPQIRRFPGSRQDRLPSVGRQHLTPFTIAGQSPNFEEGDDSIVPSTPTLLVPRRTDGFAEAINSPHVPSVRFLFSSSENSSTQQGLSQLASQGALGMDDTRMDLSQFDEGGGRTVPSTPIQISPPGEVSLGEVPEIVIVEAVEHLSETVVPNLTIESVVSLASDTGDTAQISSTAESDQTTSSNQLQVPQPDEKPALEEVRTSAFASSDVVSESANQDAASADAETSQGTQPAQPTRKPIVWEEEKPAASTNVAASSVAPPPPAPVLPASVAPSQFSPPTHSGDMVPRRTRGRGLRFREDGHFPRAVSSWPPRSRRGRAARKSRMF